MVLVTTLQRSSLTMESKVQALALTSSADRLADAALVAVEDGLRGLRNRPQKVDGVSQTKVSITGSDWVVFPSENAIPPLDITTSPLVRDRDLLWWEQPEGWWQRYGAVFQSPYPLGPAEVIHIVIVERGVINAGMDQSTNGLYSIDPVVVAFDVFVRAQNSKGTVRRKASTFSTAFY